MLRSSGNILLFLLITTASWGQALDTIGVQNKFLPTGIRVGTDLISLIRTQTDNRFSGYEFNADVDFYRYYLALEVGKWERDFTVDEEYYSNSGTYGRIGVDVNFLLKDPEKNMFFFGARYAKGTFSEDLTVATIDPVWGAIQTTYTNVGVNANWMELTTGLRVKMWKFFWMGYTARFKFGLNTDQPAGLISYDVPGYGKTERETTWGFNYQIMFRIPFRKEKQKVTTD